MPSKDWVSLLSILTADLSFENEYMEIKTSKKRPWTPSFLNLSNSFCRAQEQSVQAKSPGGRGVLKEQKKFFASMLSYFKELCLAVNF